MVTGHIPAPISGVKGLVFGLADATTKLNGVYAFDPAGKGPLTRLEKAGFSLQAVSPDGHKLLVNYGAELYLLRLDGSPPQLISNSFSGPVWHGAAWLPDGSKLALLDRRDGQDGVWLVDEKGAGWQRLSPAELQAGAVYPGPDAGHVYWGVVSCAQNADTGQNTCGYGRVFSSALDGGPPQELAGVRNPVFAPGGAYFAYTTDNPQDKSSIFVAGLDRKVDRRIELGGTGSDFRVMDYAWSPDGKQLAVQVVARDTYTGRLEDTAHGGHHPGQLGHARAAVQQWAGDAGHLVAGRRAGLTEFYRPGRRGIPHRRPYIRPGERQNERIG